jgi:hypothetical protein
MAAGLRLKFTNIAIARNELNEQNDIGQLTVFSSANAKLPQDSLKMSDADNNAMPHGQG